MGPPFWCLIKDYDQRDLFDVSLPAFALALAFFRLTYSSTETPATAARMSNNHPHAKGLSSTIGAAALAVSSSSIFVSTFFSSFFSGAFCSPLTSGAGLASSAGASSAAFAVAALGENLNLIFQIKNSGMSGIRPSAYLSFFCFCFCFYLHNYSFEFSGVWKADDFSHLFCNKRY